MRIVEFSGEAYSTVRPPLCIPKPCKSRLVSRPARRFSGFSPSLNLSDVSRAQRRQPCSALLSPREAATLASSARDPEPGTATVADSPRSNPATRVQRGAPGGPEEEPEAGTSGSFQIGLDPFSQQLIASALTAGGAAAVATWAHIDLSAALRPEPEALSVAAQLAAPVLLLLLAVVTPRWAPPYKGSELERLRHNYYMTAQVLQLYLNFDDDDEELSGGDGDKSKARPRSGGSGSDSDGDALGGGGERARVRRRLRLEQAMGWGTISSGLALMQAFTLQPWNPPTANAVFGLGLAGRTAQQLANEYLVRGVGWGLLSSWVAGELSAADASDGILFFGKVFGGPDTVKYVAGLALVALSLPGALWEARAARNFVRASVVGPVRDAAIFCTGNGVDEPAYCDPRGFAMMAARKPANAAFVADVVTRTRGWRSGPEASFSSVSSMGSVDMAEVDEAGQRSKAKRGSPGPASLQTPAPSTSAQAGTTAAEPSSAAHPTTTPAPRSPPSPEPDHTSASACSSSSPDPSSPSGDAAGSAAPRSRGAPAGEGSRGPGAAAASAAPPAASPQPAAAAPLGATLRASSAAFEWDSEDMSVLLRVETIQDRIAFWTSLYYQLLAAFAINGAFLASDCNLSASLLAVWLLRTGPLLLAELRARAAADVAMR